MTGDFGSTRRATAAARRLARRRRLGAAYTVIEVLMSMAVFAVGAVGIIATEKITIASNLHAKNLAIATHIAEAWLGVLEAESALWATDGTMTRTTWLAQGAGVSTWFRPNDNATLEFGPAFDALGNPVRTANQNPDARFCVDLRLSPLTTVNTGGGMIRAEVRVVWLRSENAISGAGVAHACAVPADTVDTAGQSELFHFVYMTGAVRQVRP